MGSGSSVNSSNNHHHTLQENTYTSLLQEAPDKLGEEDFKNLCGDDFDRTLYLSLQKPDGYVDKDELISVTHGEEHEVYKLYRSYASDEGTISQKSFNSLCRDSKLFSKSGGYAISDSSITFEEGLSSSASSLVNYDTFRNNMLPAIASKKGVHLQELVRRLSHVELPESKAVIPLEVTEHNLSPEAAAAQLMLLTGDDDEENEKLHIQWRAAVKLQRIERVRIARRKLRMKHELKDCILLFDPQKDFYHPHEHKQDLSQQDEKNQDETQRDEALLRLFHKYSTRNEMNQAQFVTLCRDLELISRKFTALDVKLVFDKSKGMALAPRSGQEYNAGVFYDKRISYKVFQEVLIPCLARDMGISYDNLFNILSLDI